MGDLGVRATENIIEDLQKKSERAAHKRAGRLQAAFDREHKRPDEG